MIEQSAPRSRTPIRVDRGGRSQSAAVPRGQSASTELAAPSSDNIAPTTHEPRLYVTKAQRRIRYIAALPEGERLIRCLEKNGHEFTAQDLEEAYQLGELRYPIYQKMRNIMMRTADDEEIDNSEPLTGEEQIESREVFLKYLTRKQIDANRDNEPELISDLPEASTSQIDKQIDINREISRQEQDYQMAFIFRLLGNGSQLGIRSLGDSKRSAWSLLEIEDEATKWLSICNEIKDIDWQISCRDIIIKNRTNKKRLRYTFIDCS